MKTIFSEERGLVPDGQTLSDFLYENKIEPDTSYGFLRVDKYDWVAKFYKATNGKFYGEINSCGYELILTEFESEQEYRDRLTYHLLVCCGMKFLSNNNPS